MNERKIWYIVLVIGLAFILAGLIAAKLVTPNNEKLPDIEQVQTVQENTAEQQTEEAEQIRDEVEVNKNKPVPQKRIRKIAPPKPKAAAPAINPKYVKEASVQETSYGRKFTPEEEEALKKVPTSKEVVVDKEIKLKSSGKYYFK